MPLTDPYPIRMDEKGNSLQRNIPTYISLQDWDYFCALTPRKGLKSLFIHIVFNRFLEALRNANITCYDQTQFNTILNELTINLGTTDTPTPAAQATPSNDTRGATNLGEQTTDKESGNSKSRSNEARSKGKFDPGISTKKTNTP